MITFKKQSSFGNWGAMDRKAILRFIETEV
jgi:hypothetical protein